MRYASLEILACAIAHMLGYLCVQELKRSQNLVQLLPCLVYITYSPDHMHTVQMSPGLLSAHRGVVQLQQFVKLLTCNAQSEHVACQLTSRLKAH